MVQVKTQPGFVPLRTGHNIDAKSRLMNRVKSDIADILVVLSGNYPEIARHLNAAHEAAHSEFINNEDQLDLFI